jgi:hypothetical protein
MLTLEIQAFAHVYVLQAYHILLESTSKSNEDISEQF